MLHIIAAWAMTPLHDWEEEEESKEEEEEEDANRDWQMWIFFLNIIISPPVVFIFRVYRGLTHANIFLFTFCGSSCVLCIYKTSAKIQT